MSAIAGIYFLDERPVNSTHLQQMLASLAHRGPDKVDFWHAGAIGLGHRMLWTTPESLAEKLPLANQNGELVLTADARIDNRDELISVLGLTGRLKAEIADSELILSAYEKWGDRCPEKLIGDFAFVIWDRRRRVLFCARDHFGVKPLYYYRSDRVFVFASELKALFSLPEVPRQLNETRVGDYLLPILTDKTITFYQDIFRLAPGHYMVVGRQEVQQPYWSLNPTYEVCYGSNEEYAEEFREIFIEAVRCRLRSAFPVGSTLSGGLDSSAVTCTARELLGERQQPLHTFSAIFDQVTQCDERPFIHTVLAQGKVEPHYVHADQISPFTDINRVLWHEDEPFCIPNLFIFWGLYGAAQQQGVRVFLDGHDGDTTVSHGFSYITELARNWQWFVLATEVNQLAKRFQVSPWSIVLRYGLKPLAPDPIRQLWKRLRRRNSSRWNINPTLNHDFASNIALKERIQVLQAHRTSPPQTAREAHYRGLIDGLNPVTFEEANKAAAAFSIELRHPFFDKRLAEFCLSLPPTQKLYQGWTRIVMRRAMSNILPVEVQWRSGKANLSSNFMHGLLTFDQELLEEFILNHAETIDKYVNINALCEVYARFISHKTYNAEALILWRSVLLSLWLHQASLV